MRFLVKNRLKSIGSKHTSLSPFDLTRLQDRDPENAWISSFNEDRLSIEVYSSVLGMGLVNVKADYGDYRYLSKPIALSATVALTQANPVVVETEDPHELETGQTVYFLDLEGMVELNDFSFLVTVIDSTSFSLDGVDGSGFGAHTVETGSLHRVYRSGQLVFRDVENLPDFMEGVISQIKDTWANLPYIPKSGTLQINLNADLDKKDVIYDWASATTDDLGHFRDEATNPVPLNHFIKVGVGSIVLFEPTTATVNQISRAGSGNLQIDLVANVGLVDDDWIVLDQVTVGGMSVKINMRAFQITNLSGDTFELAGTDKIYCELGGAGGAVSRVYQITEVLDQGTGSADVTLFPDPAATTRQIRKILTGVSAGVLDVGYVLQFIDFNEGRSDDRFSYSPKKRLDFGKTQAEHEGQIRTPQGTIVLHVDDYNRFIDFAEEFDGEPFSCLLFEFGSKSRNAGYFILDPFPTSRQIHAEWYEVGISMVEFI